MKDFNLRKYLAEGKLLKEGLKLEQNPFDQQGLFLSNDGGRSGVFITTDLDLILQLMKWMEMKKEEI